jgi:hypothetical protein
MEIVKILEKIKIDPLSLQQSYPEIQQLIKLGKKLPEQQEVSFAKLLIDHGFTFVKLQKKQTPTESFCFQFQPNGTQRSPDFIVFERGKKIIFDLKSTDGKIFKWNDGFFTKVENTIYIINHVHDSSHKLYIGLGELSSTEKDRIAWYEIREKLKELNKLVKNTDFLKIYVRQASGHNCSQFTDEFSEKNFQAVIKFLE